MFRHILIATDGSPLSQAAIEKAMDFARDAGARVTVVTATEPFLVVSTDSRQIAETRMGYSQHIKAEAARHLAEAEAKARDRGVACQVVQLEHEHPHQAIIDTAEKSGCDLIAMASRGRRGVAAVVVGSVTNKVLTHTTIPVLVYH